MDLSYLESFINPIVDNEADFVKGNRFINLPIIQKCQI